MAIANKEKKTNEEDNTKKEGNKNIPKEGKKKVSKILTQKEKKEYKSKINRTFLIIFLAIILISLALKIIDGILLDLGWNYNGQKGVNLTFWMDEKNLANGLDATGQPLQDAIDNPGKYPFFLGTENVDGNPLYNINYSMIARHPSSLWLITQFTWLTTFIVIILLFFRIFKYEGRAPKWLRWIMTQRTLSLIAMYDMIVATVFWVGMFNKFNETFVGDLKGLELTVTILVHALIPILLLSYTITFLLKDVKASSLTPQFVIRGMIYPIIYILSYLVISIIWSDPYAITDIHKQIMAGNNWTDQLWAMPIAVVGIFVLLGMMFLMHNFILRKFNKNYNPDKDYEVIKRKMHKKQKEKLKKLKRKMEG